MPHQYWRPEWVVRTAPSGKQQFVRSFSFSHGLRHHDDHLFDHHHDDHHDHHHLGHHFHHHDRHHHHRHRHHHRKHKCPENCARVTVDEWNNILEQKRDLAELNATTSRENETLKNDLQATTEDLQRSRVVNQELTDENHQLRHSISHDGGNTDKFRRRVSILRAEVEKKDHTIHHLQKDVSSLTARIRELTRNAPSDAAEKIAELTRNVFRWQDRADELQRIARVFEKRWDEAKHELSETKALLDARSALLDKRDRLLEHYRHRIRHLEGLLPHHHHDHSLFD